MSEEIKTERRGGYRPNAGRPKGSGLGRKLGNAHKEAIVVGQIEKLLADHYLGKSELSATQLKAIELRYSRLRPTLSSIEQTNIDPRDAADPGALLQQLQALIAEKPHLLELLNRSASATNAVHNGTSEHIEQSQEVVKH